MKTPQPVTRLMQSESEIQHCFPVIRQLRIHLSEAVYVAQVLRQQADFGYRLAAALEGDTVRAVAGFRVSESLAWGKFLYIDDIVSDEAVRGQGFGRSLFEFVKSLAIAEGCQQLHLDSGVQRFDAHRFYLKNSLDITSHHFGMKLP